MKTILVVEDDADNRVILNKILSSDGFRVVEAADGADVMNIVFRESPCLVLMDLALPHVDGWEATRRLKANPDTAHIPVVALTAFAMRGDEEQARAAGCDEYLPKPARPSAIRALVRRLVGAP